MAGYVWHRYVHGLSDDMVGRARDPESGWDTLWSAVSTPSSATSASYSMTFDDRVDDVFDEAMEILLQKHHDYGPHNIGQSPGGPMNGLIVRMWDKLARLINLHESGEDPEVEESIRDTLLDLGNYALIGVLVTDGNWPDGSDSDV